jgi:eukaryotic-like serine/threonine-protein kinase
MPSVADRTVNVLAPDTADPDAYAATREQTEPSRFSRSPAPAGYEILGELGRGGMGVVYQARQTKLNRLVALKMILAGGHASPAALARFRAEAEAVAALQHPNVVQVYDYGEHDGLPYFAMEFVPGGTLAARVHDRPLPAREAAALMAGIADGVQAAHTVGIVHRDLKPENVLLVNDQCPMTKDQPRSADFGHSVRPKVTDFGLAKKVDTADGLTATGAVLGTPGYMAPEQAAGAGKTADVRTDVYGLGAILYRILTGRPPFQAATMTEILMQVMVEEPVPPARLNPGVPADLETVCLKCLEKEPSRRYQTAAELAGDLRRFLDGLPVTARRVSTIGRARRWARRNPMIAGLAAGLALVLVTGTVVSTTFAVRAHNWSVAARDELEENKQLRQHERETMKKLFLYLKDRPDMLQSPMCDILDKFRAENGEVPHHVLAGLEE